MKVEKEAVILEGIVHRNRENIAIRFARRKELGQVISRIPNIKWSKTHGCWMLPLTKANYQQIISVCQGLATINHSGLKQYLELRKQKSLVLTDGICFEANLPNSIPSSAHDRQIGFVAPEGISAENTQEWKKLIDELTLKAYSNSTIKTYRNEFAAFLRAIGNVRAVSLNEEQIKRYLLYCYEKLGLSENSLHSRMNALKFYYEQVLKRERFFWQIPRPKRPIQLPKLLSEDELARLFNSLSNKKHKAMLFTAYSAGLRVSEIVNLRIADIDSGRMQILIRRAKGKKDRYVNLSPVLLDILRDYIKTYDPPPREYLFESEQSFTAYPVRTVQQIFTNAKNKAGIRKEIGVHSLRHSFATQLLDKGTDIRYIKDILGHFNIKTTERYLHVSKAKLVNIASPLDDLWRSHSLEW